MSTAMECRIAPTWFLAGEVEELGTSRRIDVSSTPFPIGRNSDLKLSLLCATVSKLHAELYLDGARLWVRDLKSTNGTYINGRRINDPTPLQTGDLLQFGNRVFQVGCNVAAPSADTECADVADQALAMLQFDRLMSDRAVMAFYQPIVDLRDASCIGYEVLGRSRLYGLGTPKAMFEAAARFQLEADLSRILRAEGVQAARDIPRTVNLFMNTHPAEMPGAGLLDSLTEVRRFDPQRPLTLEIHESSVTDPRQMRELQAGLAALRISMAYDDFGAGQSRLLELFEVPPDYLKFDIQLVHNVHRASERRQTMLATLVSMAREAGIRTVAEGLENQDDAATCAQLGFELGQGFYFGRPGLPRDLPPQGS
jgi:EAL domain-containing protein (putative c-di-GMP-specific phosphodiesterase class I)